VLKQNKTEEKGVVCGDNRYSDQSRMSIQETLETLGLASEQTTTHFHKGTRDNPNIDVYRDKNSGVIYIKDFYVAEEEYESGEYRNDSAALTDKKSQYKDYERANDCARRTESLRQFYIRRQENRRFWLWLW